MKLDRENLFLWRHLDINSNLLLSVVTLSAEEIISFFVKHKSHLLDMFVYAEVLFNICQSIRKILLARFSCQMYFDSSVSFVYFARQKLIMWFVNRLNGVAVEPIYIYFFFALQLLFIAK